jgi:hypothetical protein
VTSVTGIRAYAKGYGPQQLAFGKLKATGYASINTMENLNVEFPIEVQWVNGYRSNSQPDKSIPSIQKITKVYGVKDARTEFNEEMSLILVFNGSIWIAYYSTNSSLQEEEINSVIDLYQGEVDANAPQQNPNPSD